MSEITQLEPFTDGDYLVTIVIGTGTAKLQYSNSSQAAQDIPSASWTASSSVLMSIPDGNITPVLTGDAQVFIVPKRSV